MENKKPWQRDIDERMSDSLRKKEKGNEFFKEKKYGDAGEQYIGALKDIIPVLQDNHQIHLIKMNCYANLAACQINLSQYNRAIANCTKCLSCDSSHIKCLYRRAFSYLKLNDLENASTDISSLISLNPDNAAALSLQQQLQKQIGDKDKNDAIFMKKYFHT